MTKHGHTLTFKTELGSSATHGHMLDKKGGLYLDTQFGAFLWNIAMVNNLGNLIEMLTERLNKQLVKEYKEDEGDFLVNKDRDRI